MSFLRMLATFKRIFTSFLTFSVSSVKAPAKRVSFSLLEIICSGLVLSGGLVKCTSEMLSRISRFRYGLYRGLLGKANLLDSSKPI